MKYNRDLGIVDDRRKRRVLRLWCKSVHMGRNKRKQDETLETSVNDDDSFFFKKKKKKKKKKKTRKKETSLAWARETH